MSSNQTPLHVTSFVVGLALVAVISSYAMAAKGKGGSRRPAAKATAAKPAAKRVTPPTKARTPLPSSNSVGRRPSEPGAGTQRSLLPAVQKLKSKGETPRLSIESSAARPNPQPSLPQASSESTGVAEVPGGNWTDEE